MSIIVVGGHSRSVGKTSVVAGIISALPQYRWLVIKVTQYGHGVCSANGEPCDCQPGADEHEWAITEERDRSGESDTSRFLVAGAVRSLWVRTRQGMLAEAMPRLRQRMEEAKSDCDHVIFESNSVLRFVNPDLYVSVLDFATADFKPSAREMLDRADVVLLHRTGMQLVPQWQDVSLKLLEGKRVLPIAHREYVPRELVEMIQATLVMS
ncbi:MAG: hypothetical protein JOZ43_08220 [Acidobacteriales bacterium]|nr:hypothetical protein [Terriglobales bacterium]